MKEYVAETGGRYTYADDVLGLQELALSMTALLADCSAMILCGCEVDGAAISPGYVWLGGKVRRWEGCVDAAFPYYLYEHNSVESVAYAKQVNKRGRIAYLCVGGKSVPDTEDAVTGALPSYIELTREYAPRLRDKFFGKYAVLLEPLRSQKVLRDLTVGGRLTAAKDIESEASLVALGTDGYSLRQKITPTGGASLGLYKESSLLCEITVGADGVVAFTRRGELLATLSAQGLRCGYGHLTTARIGSLSLSGAAVCNVGDNDDRGAVKINVEGYEGGVSRYRDFEVYDGRRCAVPLFRTEGRTRSTTVDGALCVSNVTEGILLRHPYLASDPRLTGSLAWLDSNDEQIAAIGFTSGETFDLSLSSNVGNIMLCPREHVDVLGALRVNGADIATTYITQKSASEALAGKVDKVSGKGLSTEDFTPALRRKLESISTGGSVVGGPGYVTGDDIKGALGGKLSRSSNLGDVDDVPAARANLEVYAAGECDKRYFRVPGLLSEVISLSASEIEGMTPEQIIALREQKQQTVRDNIGAEKCGMSELRLSKAQDLADVADRKRARENLDVYSTAQIDGMLAGKLNSDSAYIGEVFTTGHKSKLEGIKTGNFPAEDAAGSSQTQVEGYVMTSAVKRELDKKSNLLLDNIPAEQKPEAAANIGVYTTSQADAKFAGIATLFQDYITLLVSQGKSTLEAQRLLREKLAAAGSKELTDNYLRKDSRLADLVVSKVEDKRLICNKLGAAYAEDFQPRLQDTGWLQMSNSGSGTDTRGFFIRQIGNIVSIQGYINTAQRDGSNWGGIVAVIPNKIEPPRYSVRCTAANWNDDHAYNRGCTFVVYGGTRQVHLFESGMYRVDVELNFTYFV